MTDPTFSTIRARLRYRSLDEFVEGYGKFISRGGMFVPMAAPKLKPVGTTVRFQFLLADGTSAFLGEGIVRQIKGVERESEGGPVGMLVKFTKLSQDSKSVVERIVAEKMQEEEIEESDASDELLSAREAPATAEQPISADAYPPESSEYSSTTEESNTGVLAAGEANSLLAEVSNLDNREDAGRTVEQAKPEESPGVDNTAEVELPLEPAAFNPMLSEANTAATRDGDLDPVSEPALGDADSDGDEWGAHAFEEPSEEEEDSGAFPFAQPDAQAGVALSSDDLESPEALSNDDEEESDDEYGFDAFFEADDAPADADESDPFADAIEDDESDESDDVFSAVASEDSQDIDEPVEEVVDEKPIAAPKAIKETEAGIKVMSFDGEDIDESATREFEEFATAGDEGEFDELFDNIFGGDGGDGLFGGDDDGEGFGMAEANSSPPAEVPAPTPAPEPQAASLEEGLDGVESSFGIELDEDDVAEELPSPVFGEVEEEVPMPAFGESAESLPAPSLGGEDEASGLVEDSNEEFLDAWGEESFAEVAAEEAPPSVEVDAELLADLSEASDGEPESLTEESSEPSWSMPAGEEEAPQGQTEEDSSDKILSLLAMDEEEEDLSLNLSAGLRGESSSVEDEEEDSLRSLMMSEKMKIESRHEGEEEEDSDRDILDDLLGDDDLPPPVMAPSFEAPKPGEKKKKGFMSKLFGKD